MDAELKKLAREHGIDIEERDLYAPPAIGTIPTAAGGTSPSINPAAGMIGPGSEDVKGMKKVLEAFYRAGGEVAEDIATKATVDPIYEEYLAVAPERNAIRVGKKYEIRVREIESIGGDKKVYDIVEIKNNETLTSDLFLYEAAYAIVKYLNKGENILSAKIREIAALEQCYANLRQDAGLFKKRIREAIQTKNETKIALFEDRFDKAKNDALQIKSKIRKITEQI